MPRDGLRSTLRGGGLVSVWVETSRLTINGVAQMTFFNPSYFLTTTVVVGKQTEKHLLIMFVVQPMDGDLTKEQVLPVTTVSWPRRLFSDLQAPLYSFA